MLNDSVHLGFQLCVEFRETPAHAAVFTHLFGDDFIQRDAAFLHARQRALIDPRQRGAQRFLVVERLLALGGGKRHRLAVKLHRAVRANHQIAVFAHHLHMLGLEHHVVARRDAAFVFRLGLHRCHQQHAQQRFTHHTRS